MTSITDKQLQQFFAGHKKEIADKGFSDKVIHRLPEKQRTPGLVWIFATLSTLAVILGGNYERMFQIVTAILEQAWWFLPITSCIAALVIIWGVTAYERKISLFR